MRAAYTPHSHWVTCFQVRKAKESDRAALAEALSARDSEVNALAEELAEARASQALLRKELEATVARAERAAEAKRRTEEELQECQGRVSDSAEALRSSSSSTFIHLECHHLQRYGTFHQRSQLRRAEQEHEDASLAAAAWRREAQRREAELEQSNAGIAASLALVNTHTSEHK
jgi:hypothetical protein